MYSSPETLGRAAKAPRSPWTIDPSTEIRKVALRIHILEGVRVRLTQKYFWGEAGDEGYVAGKLDSNGNCRVDLNYPATKPPLFGVPPAILEIVD